jgi:hypothetical protein
MLNYLSVSHKFFPAWQAVTTYIGSAIWLISLLLTAKKIAQEKFRILLTFIGAFIWNLGIFEAARYFLSA